MRFDGRRRSRSPQRSRSQRRSPSTHNSSRRLHSSQSPPPHHHSSRPSRIHDSNRSCSSNHSHHRSVSRTRSRSSHRRGSNRCSPSPRLRTENRWQESRREPYGDSSEYHSDRRSYKDSHSAYWNENRFIKHSHRTCPQSPYVEPRNSTSSHQYSSPSRPQANYSPTRRINLSSQSENNSIWDGRRTTLEKSTLRMSTNAFLNNIEDHSIPQCHNSTKHKDQVTLTKPVEKDNNFVNHEALQLSRRNDVSVSNLILDGSSVVEDVSSDIKDVSKSVFFVEDNEHIENLSYNILDRKAKDSLNLFPENSGCLSYDDINSSPKIPRRLKRQTKEEEHCDHHSTKHISPVVDAHIKSRSFNTEGILCHPTKNNKLSSDNKPGESHHIQLPSRRRRYTHKLSPDDNDNDDDDHSQHDDVEETITSTVFSGKQRQLILSDDSSSETEMNSLPKNEIVKVKYGSKNNIHSELKRPSKQKQCDTSYILSPVPDRIYHLIPCYVCGKNTTLLKNDDELYQTTQHASLHCSSCLLSYHKDCLSEEQTLSVTSDENSWICPKCEGLFVYRKVPFFRNGKKTLQMQSHPCEDEYLEKIAGLTGSLTGCGHCGAPSSQRRMAVICDHCEREFHLQCLQIDELPWGNWFCPDCLNLRICATCVILSDNEEKDSNNHDILDDNSDSKSDTITHRHKDLNHLENKDNNYYYHKGKLITCGTCYMKYHIDCVQHGLPAHLKYDFFDLQTRYLELRQSQLKDTPKNNVSVKRFLRQSGLSRTSNEFWCCLQCQEHFGIQRIVGQRRWVDPMPGIIKEQIQLLVKIKTLSYRRLMWLPLDRVKMIYPIGVRKWLTSSPAIRLLDTTSNHFTKTPEDEDEEDDDNEMISDDPDTTTEDIHEISENIQSSVLFNDENNKNSKTHSSSFTKVNLNEGREFILHVRRPAGIKKEWFSPSRVIAQRYCSRGTLKCEYLVKWVSLSYEETTWESYLIVHGTRAFKLFQACSILEKIISDRPTSIIRCMNDPTVTDIVLPENNHPPPPEGAIIVDQSRYIIKTSAIDIAQSLTKDTNSSEHFLSKMKERQVSHTHELDDNDTLDHATDQSSTLLLEKRRRNFLKNMFVPYFDRPHFLSGHYLFDYQIEGINWLRFAWHKHRSVILADEMGLGKTVQVISFLGSLWNDYSVQGPFLVIAPLATLEDVWVRELAHWVPFINVVSYFGNPEARQICRDCELFSWPPSRVGHLQEWIQSTFSLDTHLQYNRDTISPRLPKLAGSDRFAKFDLLVTSYEIFRKDHWLFRQIHWKVIVVDEGHRLKSFGSEIKRALEACHSDMRLLLTGTPLQNSIDELFSLLNVLHPEKFPESSKDDFQDVVTQETTIERLKAELQPHILRRTKRDVMGGRMPAKKERLLRIENSPTQKEIYKNIILRNHDILSAGNGGKKQVRVTSLRNIVMQMRKCCNHPYLFEDIIPSIRTEKEFNDLVESSGKLKLLDRMLQLLIPKGHRILIFSQFMRMLNVLEEYLNYRQYGYERLDGSTSASDRQRAIDRFNIQVHRKFVFLLSTRAGGLGINLTSADTVIIFDSDWNPHNDLQAQARAHRLGQTKKVAIYRFMTRATVEERIIEIARNKLVLDQVVAGKISPRDVEAVVRCGAKELFDEKLGLTKEVHYDDTRLAQLMNREDTDAFDDPDDRISSQDTPVVKESVLDSFKVARFEEVATGGGDNSVTGNMIEEESFWENLLHQNESITDDLFPNSCQQVNTLGRGMRARREASYFSQDRSRDCSVIEDQDDDLPLDHDDDEEDEKIKIKGKGNESRISGILQSQKLNGRLSPPLNNQLISTTKKPKKGKKHIPDFFDHYGVFVFNWIETHKISNIHFIIDSTEDIQQFKQTSQQFIPILLEKMKLIRRSLGLSENSKIHRYTVPEGYDTVSDSSMITKNDKENDCLDNSTDSVTIINESSTKNYCSGFGMLWDKEWLARLLKVQLAPQLQTNQAFVIKHSERHFLLCSPVHATMIEKRDMQILPFGLYVAAIREMTSEEVTRWMSQLSSTLLRPLSVSYPTHIISTDSPNSLKSLPKSIMFPLNNEKQGHTIQRPDLSSLRNILNDKHRKPWIVNNNENKMHQDEELFDQDIYDSIEEDLETALEECQDSYICQCYSKSGFFLIC